MLAFVKSLCHNEIVATATEKEASLLLMRGLRAGSGSYQTKQRRQVYYDLQR